MCLVLLIPAQIVQATGVTITVSGVKGGLYENVMAHLSINRHRESARLTSSDIRRLHKKASQEIASALAPFGYYQPQVETTLEQEGDEFKVNYIIDKGDPVRVSRVDITVEGEEHEYGIFFAIREQFPLQEGEILNHSLYENGKKAILRTAYNNGYLEATFLVQELRIDRENREAQIILRLLPGAQFVFGETSFEESGVTAELLEKLIPYKEGDPYKPSDLIALQKILYRTEYFSKVVVEGRVQERNNQKVPVKVYVTVPDKHNLYSIGLGYATDTGPRARLEWRNKLLNKKGILFSVLCKPAIRTRFWGWITKFPWGIPTMTRLL